MSLAAPPSTPVAAARAGRRGGVLLLLGVLLVAVNLRAVVTSLGALLDDVRSGLGLSGTLAGVLTMLPTLSFAAFGIATPWLTRRFSPARILVAAMVVLAGGQAARAVTDSAAVFLLTSALALAGIAVANVLLPGVVKQFFPHRVGLITGVYTMTLIAGGAVAAASAVPIAHAAGSWRAGLGAWVLLAAVAVTPWLPAALRRQPPAAGHASVDPPVRPARTRLGWAMAAFFGAQALIGYALMGWLAQLFRDAGFSPTAAGLLLSLVIALTVPVALVLPTLAGRAADLRLAVLLPSVATAVAFLGLAVAPATLALLWVVLLAIGQAAFPLGLTMIGLRARTAAGTVALSAFAQSAGYLLAAGGPLLMGVLYDTTAGWTLPLAFLLGVVVVQAVTGVAVARPRYLEDVLVTKDGGHAAGGAGRGAGGGGADRRSGGADAGAAGRVVRG